MGKLKLPQLTLVAALLYVLIKVLSLDSVGALNGYFMIIINRSLIFVILTVSLNLINGITGQFSLGHMGFAAVGAYVSGTITTLVLKLSPDVVSNYPIFIGAIILGGIGAAVAGLVIGFPSLRLKGDYLAIMTLGFGEVIRIILNNIDYVGGPRGLLGIPKFSTFTIIYVFTFFTIVLIRNLIQSSHGRAMLAVRENEVAAELVGVDTTRYKVLGFVVGAFFAGIGGGLLAHLLQIATPTQYGFYASALLLVYVYAGGMGSITGSIIAAFGLTFLSQFLQLGFDSLSSITGINFGSEWTMVIYALLLILIMLYKTEGLMGMKEAKLLVIEEGTK
ncbi:MAG TPA: branched-chain amino acid ABC transporter permease [Rectinemataceae bacterium]|nr:branched-chain amino acid ABC transporter permease [Rectinemataceae bacterium]